MSLACAEGVPTVIYAPSPIAAAARAVVANLVERIVVMRLMLVFKWCFRNRAEARFHSKKGKGFLSAR